MWIDKNLKRTCAFQPILNGQPWHIRTYLIRELRIYVAEMRKNK